MGAGASGLMCAAQLSENSSLRVGVIDVNAKVGAKLKVSGGGKCNITNTLVETKHFLGDETVLKNALAQFSSKDLLHFLAKRGLKPVIRKKRYYFCAQSSSEIITLLYKSASGVQWHMNEKVLSVTKEDDFIVTSSKNKYRTKNLVIATGGISFASLGASDIGVKIAHTFGHGNKPFQPALVGLTLQPQQFWMKELSGISFFVKIEAGGRSIEEDMLFAHRGISGPAVLSASLYWQKGTISIDFMPQQNIATLAKNSKKQLSSLMTLPKRFSKLFLESIEVPDVVYARLNSEQKERLQSLHNYNLAPAGNFGFTKAEVSKGGVLLDDIEHYTLQSKKVKGLYFCGEVLDVTGELGGYNFQWAFSSAVVVAQSIMKDSHSQSAEQSP